MKQLLTASALVGSLSLLPALAFAETTSVVNDVSSSASSGAASASAHAKATTIIDGKTVTQEERFEEAHDGADASVSIDTTVQVEDEAEHVNTSTDGSSMPESFTPRNTLEETTQISPNTELATDTVHLDVEGESQEATSRAEETLLSKVVSTVREGIQAVTSKLHHALTTILA